MLPNLLGEKGLINQAATKIWRKGTLVLSLEGRGGL